MVESSKITRFSADSIHSIDDAKRWARDFDARTESRLDQSEARIRDHEKAILRTSRWLLFSVSLFGGALAVVVLLFGINEIVRALLLWYSSGTLS